LRRWFRRTAQKEYRIPESNESTFEQNSVDVQRKSLRIGRTAHRLIQQAPSPQAAISPFG
jgi:hypothetical protein